MIVIFLIAYLVLKGVQRIRGRILMKGDEIFIGTVTDRVSSTGNC